MIPTLPVAAVPADRAAGRDDHGHLRGRQPAGGRGAGDDAARASGQHRARPALHQFDQRRKASPRSPAPSTLGVNLDIAAADVQNLGSVLDRPAARDGPASSASRSPRTPARSSWASRSRRTARATTPSSLSNYAQLNIVNNLSARAGRLAGHHLRAAPVRDAHLGQSDQAGTSRASTPTDVVTALQEQNVAVARRQHRLAARA